MQDGDVCKVSVDTFDRLAARYAAKYFDLDVYDRFLGQFAERIGQGGSVIDVACGPGNVCAYLAKTRPDLELVGVDLAAQMIEQARTRVPAAAFFVKDCRDIGEFDRTFDACAFAFGLSYLTDADAAGFFASLNAIVTRSATLYLSTITGDASWSGFESSDSGDRVYLVYRSVKDVVSMVERAGYQVDLNETIGSPAEAPKQTRDLILIARRSG